MNNIDATAYDAFGRILSSGGEQAYALGVARGYDPGRITTIMLRRYGDDFSDSGGLLDGFIAGMLLSANRINEEQGSGGSLPLSEIPNNPFIDEEQTGGNLFRWTADVEFEGGSTPVTVYGYSSSTDMETLIDDAIQGGIGIADQYRGKFGLDPNAPITPTKVVFLTMESTIANGTTTN